MTTPVEKVFPLGKKWFRLGRMDYVSKKGSKVEVYGLEEVRVVPDGKGGVAHERAFQGTRLQTSSPNELKAFLEMLLDAL
jgi:hypothetical protein